MYDVFISYRRSDGEQIAKKIYTYLTEKGLRVFFDKKKMVDSQFFHTQIINALSESPNYILIASSDILPFRNGEDWVREEIKLALDLYNKDQNARSFGVIIPPRSVFSTAEKPAGFEMLEKPNQIMLSEELPNREELNRILRSVSRVNRRNLWSAGHRWTENIKKEGHRFADFCIDESIMPYTYKINKNKQRMPINVYQKDTVQDRNTKNVSKPLIDTITSTKGHLYLIGTGGMGKTTALIQIMNNAYEDATYTSNCQIPLFIELSKAPDIYGRLYENGHSSYIRRSVYQFLCAERRFGRFNSRMVEEIDDVFNIDPEVSVNPVTDIFSNETPAPEYLLLLDGLNEVSRTAVCDNSGDLLPPVVFMLMQEIKELLQCPNVRIILTSRSDEDAIGENITRLYLAGVDTTSIRNYLIKGNMDNQTVDSILKNQSLIETLKIPLYLSIYSTLNNIEGVTTQGEIFKLFFSERAEELNVYTCQKRIATIEHNIIDTGSIVQKNRIDTKMQWFMIDFLLPEIAWFMEKQNRFYLDIEEISEIIEPILTVTSDDSVCGRFGKKIFYKYRSASNMKSHTKKIAKKLIDIGDDIEEVTETIVECCVMSLGILQENSGSFGFIHHHIRDYFASIRHINKFRLAVCLHEEGVSSAIDCLKEFQSAPISYEVRRFLGEILGEHHNRPYYDEQSNQWRYNVPEQNCDRSLIVRILDMYRGEFDNDNYAVYNLITILKEIRVDLSGEDFSYLNLEKCTFNRVRLGNRSLGAKFRGSKLNSGTLFPQSHSREICSAKFSPDGKYILTASKDGLAKLWLSDTLVCANTFLCKGRLGEKYEGENIAEFSPDGKYIVTGSFDGTLRIWDTKDFSCIKDWCVSGSVRCIAFNPTCDLMAVTICNGSPPAFPENWQTIIWDTTNFMSISNLHEVGYVSYTPDGRYFVTTSDTKGLGCGEISVSLKIWDAEKINCIKEITISQEQNASYYCEEASKPIISRDGKYIITVSQTGHIRIWEAESYTCIGLLKGHTKKICSAALSYDNKHLVTSSLDGTIRLWNIKTQTCVRILKEDTNLIHMVSFSPDGNIIISASDDKTVGIWDVKTMSKVGEIKADQYRINDIQYSPDSSKLATASQDGVVRIWNPVTGICIETLYNFKESVESINFNYNGTKIITTTYNGINVLWDTETYQPMKEISHISSAEDEYICPACFSPDGTKIVAQSGDYETLLYDAESYELCLKLGNWNNLARYSIDGRYFVKTKFGFSVWDTESWRLVFQCDYKYLIDDIAFDCNNKLYVAVKDNLEIFNIKTNEKIGTLYGNLREPICHVCLNPNGTQIVTSGLLITKIWDANTLKCIDTIDKTGANAVYSPDGFNLATVSWDGAVNIWDVEKHDSIRILNNISGLIVHCVEFTNLHPDTKLTQKDKEILKMYGAIID